jgi:hypothetical protein
MTEPDGPPVDPNGSDLAPEVHVDDPLLPPTRVVAPRDERSLRDGDLGSWFAEVEMEAPTVQETLRLSEQTASRKAPPPRRSTEHNIARAQVYGIAVLAALVALFADGRPTGLVLWDACLRMVLAFGVTVACSHARRWTWMVLSGAAAAASRDLAPVLMAWSALGLSLAAAVFDFRRRRVGAAVGALAVNALLRLNPVGFHGATALLAAAVIVPVLISAYRVQHRKVQKRVLLATWSVAGLVVVAVGALGVAGLLGVGHVAAAQDAATSGLELAKGGHQDESSVQFTISADEFESAEGFLRSWFVQPSRLVPIVGYQSDALGRMAAIGHELAGTAERVTTQADYRRIRVSDERIDVSEISAWGAPLAEIEAALVDAELASAEIETEWLAGAIHERYVELDDQVTGALDETQVARQAVEVAPDLLGANGVRRYFIAFTTPAESRGLGGFMGNWAILEADNGRLELTSNGRSSELARRTGEPERTLDAPEDYINRYGSLEPESQFRDITLSPDFPSVAQAISSVYPQTLDGHPIDGALAIDPFAIAAMLEITGPVEVEGLAEKLTSDNAADYLLREQYLQFDPTESNENAERKDVLEAASRTTFDAFINQKTFRPSQLAAVLGPIVAERSLVGFSKVPAEEALIERLGLDGAFPEATDADIMTLVTQNAGNNKMDIYLKRSIDYDVVVDPQTGHVDATATITLHNDAPSSGLPRYVIGNRESSGQPDGVNWMWFNFYSPHLLDSATWNGQPMSVGEQREFGRRVYQTYLPVPSGGDAVIVLELTGQIAPDSVYELDWFQQPVVNTDEVTVTVRSTDRSAVADGGEALVTEPVVITREERTDQHVSVTLAPSV